MKNIRKIMMIGIISILVLSGMNGASACHYDSTLIAGQTKDAGDFTVEHTLKEDRYITFTYSTTGDWVINETNLAVADPDVGIPTTKKGNPKIGHFPYKSDHDPGVTVVEYVIDLETCDSITKNDDGTYTGTLDIAAHAVVYNTATGIEETAWADEIGQPFPGGNSWAMWFPIVLD